MPICSPAWNQFQYAAGDPFGPHREMLWSWKGGICGAFGGSTSAGIPSKYSWLRSISRARIYTETNLRCRMDGFATAHDLEINIERTKEIRR